MIDYEKEYKTALDRAKKLKETCDNTAVIGWCEYIFPELYESEDERIKNEIIDYISTADDKVLIPYESWIAWLEKQGGQKSMKVLKKMKPKFKDGDWVVFNGLTLYINEVVKGYYRTISKNGTPNSYDWNIDNAARLWTIQEAKDGDVLCAYECCEPKIVFILKGTPKKPYVLSYYCYYNIMYPYFESNSKTGCIVPPNEEDLKPATKEQRDLLFQKMKEAGYTWHADKRELIKCCKI